MLTRLSDANKHIFFGFIICSVGALFYCYEFILRIIPGVLQEELSASFGNISATVFGELAGLYYVAYSPMQLPVGMLMDRFGPKRLMSLACLCCTAGSLMFCCSSSLLVAGAGRFLVGFGSSFAFVGVLTLSIGWLPKRFFSLVAGLITTLSMLALIYGEVNVTKFAEHYGLRSVLMIAVYLGMVLTLLIFTIVKDGPQIKLPNKTLPSNFIKEVLLVFVSKKVWLIAIVGACLYTSLSVFGELWGKSYLQQAHHLSKLDSAKTISMLFLGWAVGAPISGYLSDRFESRLVPLVVGAIGALIAISMILYCTDLSLSALKLLMFLYGIFSSVEIIVFIMAKEHVKGPLSSTVFAAINMIVTLGGVLFQPMVGFLLDYVGHPLIVNHVHIYSANDYRKALTLLPISLVVVLMTSYFIEHKK